MNVVYTKIKFVCKENLNLPMFKKTVFSCSETKNLVSLKQRGYKLKIKVSYSNAIA